MLPLIPSGLENGVQTHFSIAHAALLFGLFAGQLVAPQLVAALPGGELFGVPADHMHQLFSLLYFVAALAILVERPGGIASLWRKAEWSEKPMEGRSAELSTTAPPGRPLPLGADHSVAIRKE